MDAPGPSVVAVSCTGGIAPVATIMTADGTFAYSPNAVTIMQGQVVEFMMSGTHNVVPNTSSSDPGLMVDFGATKCLQFTKTGTFGFHCMPHGFMGTVTVN
jgi:plastocyanin